MNKEPGIQNESPEMAAAVLVWDRDTDQPREVLLETQCSVGSDSTNFICVSRADIAKFHCELRWEHGFWQLIVPPLNDSTRLNDRKVLGTTALCHNDVIHVGDVRLEFVLQSSRTENVPLADLSRVNSFLFSVAAQSEKLKLALAADESADVVLRLTDDDRIIQTIHRAFDQPQQSDLAARMTFAIEEILTATGGNFAYVQLPCKKDGGALRVVAGVSRRNANWTETEAVIGDQVLSQHVGVLRHRKIDGRTSSFFCVPIPLSQEEVGLLHVYSIAQSRSFTEEALRFGMVAAQVLGALAQRQQLIDAANHQRDLAQGVVDQLQSRVLTQVSRYVQEADRERFVKIARHSSQSLGHLLICGERGTGRYEIARGIYAISTVAKESLIEFDCAGLDHDELERQLFGQRASRSSAAQIGLIERALGGTLVLRNLEHLPLRLQVRLASILDERLLDSITAKRAVGFNARVIVLGNPDFDDAVGSGEIHLSIRALLGELRIELLPLRKRRQEMEAILRDVLNEQSRELHVRGFTPETLQAFQQHDWPGNMVELIDETQIALRVCEGSEIDVQHLSFAAGDSNHQALDDQPSLAEVESRYIQSVLAATQGNKRQAASILQINRSTLDRKLSRDQIDSE